MSHNVSQMGVSHSGTSQSDLQKTRPTSLQIGRVVALPTQHQQTKHSPKQPSRDPSQYAALQSQETNPGCAKRILFISEQAELAETIQLELSKEGYIVNVMHDGLRGLLAANRMNPDVVIACWESPRIPGMEICDRLRTGGRKGAIVLITSENTVEQRVAGFEVGADDCISLPFHREEFVARIKARIQAAESKQKSAPLLHCANLLLNKETREVFRGEQFIKLTAREFDLLEYLMEHYFQVVTRAQIIENVWGYDYVGSSNIVEVYVRYLRTKLEAVDNQRVIHTVRSVGYILRDH